MTLTEVERMDVATLTPAQVASVLHSDPQLIRVAARQRPELLGFDVIIVGNRVKIPREAFVAFMRGRRKGQWQEKWTNL